MGARLPGLGFPRGCVAPATKGAVRPRGNGERTGKPGLWPIIYPLAHPVRPSRSEMGAGDHWEAPARMRKGCEQRDWPLRDAGPGAAAALPSCPPTPGTQQGLLPRARAERAGGWGIPHISEPQETTARDGGPWDCAGVDPPLRQPRKLCPQFRAGKGSSRSHESKPSGFLFPSQVPECSSEHPGRVPLSTRTLGCTSQSYQPTIPTSLPSKFPSPPTFPFPSRPL